MTGSPFLRETVAVVDGLPLPRTTFVGRERELGSVEGLLDSHRVVTLTGPGGAGKTRLALETTRRLRERFPDGVWLVELASVAAGDLVPGTVSARLGVPEQPGRSPLDALEDRLEDGRVLLVLDSCEGVIDACAGLADALTQRCPRLYVLATSRAPLRISGEAVLTVRPLALEQEAVFLFADRAAAARPGFAISEANRAAVTELCRRLDCLPLAVELAAPLVAVMPLEELTRELDHRFEILDAGPRDVDERQRSLRASVQWSYDLLSEDERRLFRCLAVFEQAFSLEAVRAVALQPQDHPSAALRLVSRLVEKSMVTARPDEEDPRRYRLLDTLREFALERLLDAGEESTVRDRHLGHILELAESAYSEHMATGSTRPIRVLAQSADELRAALGWASTSDPTAYLRLAGALHPYWRAFAMQEGVSRLLEALESPGPATPYRARALLSAGTLAGHLHDAERARALLHESLAVATRLDDPASAAWAELELGSAAWLSLEFEQARRLLESSISAMERLPSAFGTERAALHLGTTLVWLGELERGRTMLRGASATAADLGDAWGRGVAEEMLGWAEIAAARYGEAERHLHGALAVDVLGPLRAAAIEGLAQTAAARRDPDRALRLLGVSQRMLADFNTRCAPPIAARSADLEVRLRSAVGPRRAAANLAQGRELDLADGLTYARGAGLPERQDPGSALSARELEVARLVADGLTSREIAQRLQLSLRTVESHLEHAFKKLGFNSRTKLALWVHEGNAEQTGR